MSDRVGVGTWVGVGVNQDQLGNCRGFPVVQNSAFGAVTRVAHVTALQQLSATLTYANFTLYQRYRVRRRRSRSTERPLERRRAGWKNAKGRNQRPCTAVMDEIRHTRSVERPPDACIRPVQQRLCNACVPPALLPLGGLTQPGEETTGAKAAEPEQSCWFYAPWSVGLDSPRGEVVALTTWRCGSNASRHSRYE